MNKEQESQYIQIAYDYLNPIKSSTIEIQSAKRELQRLRSDITSLSAVDYSKDRVSGGGTPTGIEDSISRLVDSEVRCIEKTNSLIAKREEAREHIEQLTCVTGKVALMQEYINGMSFKGVVSFLGYSKNRVSEFKKEGLLELGAKLCAK